jgi:hypothetical protein
MNRLDRLIRRAIAQWQSWQTRRRLYRAMPELRSLDQAEREARQRHGRVNEIQKAKHDCMLSALREGRANG